MAIAEPTSQNPRGRRDDFQGRLALGKRGKKRNRPWYTRDTRYIDSAARKREKKGADKREKHDIQKKKKEGKKDSDVERRRVRHARKEKKEQMDALPDEMVCAILSWLPPLWLSVIAQVSTRWSCCAASTAARLQPLQGAEAVPAKGQHPLLRIPKDMIEVAAGGGYLPVVLWLHATVGRPWTSGALAAAALNGHTRLVGYMLATRDTADACPIDERVLACALVGGGMPLAEEIHAAGQPWTAAIVTVAVALGDVDAVRRLGSLMCPRNDVAVTLALSLSRDDLLVAMDATDDERRFTSLVLSITKSAASNRRMRWVVYEASMMALRHGVCGPNLAMALIDRGIPFQKRYGVNYRSPALTHGVDEGVGDC